MKRIRLRLIRPADRHTLSRAGRKRQARRKKIRPPANCTRDSAATRRWRFFFDKRWLDFPLCRPISLPSGRPNFFITSGTKPQADRYFRGFVSRFFTKQKARLLMINHLLELVLSQEYLLYSTASTYNTSNRNK
jgi:hypothetical protein